MTYFDRRSETDLKHGYGYGHLNRLSFELAPDWYESLQSREWQRVFEVMQGAFEPAGPATECGCGGCLMTPEEIEFFNGCLLYTSPSPRDLSTSRMPSSA